MIKVVPYDPKWPKIFAQEAALIETALGKNCLGIHHIGSTSVPGLPAKPIIDMIPVVSGILAVDEATDNMRALGYIAKGEHGMLFRRYFQKNGFNIHVYEKDTPDIERYLKFRDWMRLHKEDREAYATLKQQLALTHPNDILSYVCGKDEFVAKIDSKTKFDGTRVVKALSPVEWDAVHSFRQQYFPQIKISDEPTASIFDHKDHLHFIMYKGAKIIGYIHIQLLIEGRAALRFIIINKQNRHSSIGSQFLMLVERWLAQQQIKKIYIRTPPESYKFFCKNNYVEMSFIDPDSEEPERLSIALGKIL